MVPVQFFLCYCYSSSVKNGGFTQKHSALPLFFLSSERNNTVQETRLIREASRGNGLWESVGLFVCMFHYTRPVVSLIRCLSGCIIPSFRIKYGSLHIMPTLTLPTVSWKLLYGLDALDAIVSLKKMAHLSRRCSRKLFSSGAKSTEINDGPNSPSLYQD